jgi:uncharacterized repeat protein (TIGR01451 family)
VLTAVMAVAIAGTAVGGPVDPADLSLTKADDPDPVTEGDVLTYTLTIRNEGPDPATAVRVEDDLPPNVDFVGANASVGTCEQQGGRVLCELGELAVGAEETVTIRIRPRKAGELSNTATVESQIVDPMPPNNTDTETTQVTEPPPAATCAGTEATILGTDGNDPALLGDGAGNVIRAFAGDDGARGRGGHDSVCLNLGNDVGRGGGGHDLVKGGAGDDVVAGGRRGDTLRGGAGNDRLRGGAGSDILRGGAGADICRGGPGKDSKRGC